jgi:AraC-like DNA-binding protein
MVWVNAASIGGYADVSRTVGLDPDRMLARVGLTQAQIDDPDARLPARAVAQLLELSARESGCRHFALLIGERRTIQTIGPLSLLIHHLETQRAVLDMIVRYQSVLTEAVSYAMEELGETTLIHVELLIDLDHDACQANELAVAAFFAVVRNFAGPRWSPESVHFIHKAPANLAAHKQVFGCPLHFESLFNGFVCSTAALNERIVTADAKPRDYLKDYLETLRTPEQGSSTSDRVRAAVRFLMPMGRATLEQTGHHMGIHARALQRQLQVEGATFGELLNEIRRAASAGYLRDSSHPLQTIAALVGFSSASSFARWFQGEFGASPSAWRNKIPVPTPATESLDGDRPPSNQAREIAWRQASERSAATRRRQAIIAGRSKNRGA